MASVRDPFPWLVSAGIHLALASLLLVGLLTTSHPPAPQRVELTVIEQPRLAPQSSTPPRVPELSRTAPPLPAKRRAVFGLARSALTSAAPDGVEAKRGNTIAKEADTAQLRPEDESELPIPTDEFLVTAMPQLADEVRVPYPAAAKAAGVQGAVVMDLLIDEEGVVRQATLREGPGYGLNEAALEAVRRFRFKAARMGERTVAVKIRYAYRFVLER